MNQSSRQSASRPPIALDPAGIAELVNPTNGRGTDAIVDRLAMSLVCEATRISQQTAWSAQQLVTETLRFYQPHVGNAMCQRLWMRCVAASQALDAASGPERAQQQAVIIAQQQVTIAQQQVTIAQQRLQTVARQTTLPSAPEPPPLGFPPAPSVRRHQPSPEENAANRSRARRGAWHVTAMFCVLLAMCGLGYAVSFAAAGGLDWLWRQLLSASAWNTISGDLPTLALVLDGGFLVGVCQAAAGGFPGVLNNIATVRSLLEVDRNRPYAGYYRRALGWTLWLSRAFAVATPLSSIVAIALVMLSVGQIGATPILAGLAGFCSVLAAGSVDTFARMATTVSLELQALRLGE